TIPPFAAATPALAPPANPRFRPGRRTRRPSGIGADEPLSTTSSSNRGFRGHAAASSASSSSLCQWTTTPVSRGSGGGGLTAWRLLLLCQIPEAADFAQRHSGGAGPGEAGE